MRSVLRPHLLILVLLGTSLVCTATTHVLTASPSSYNFGSQSVGSTTSHSVTVTNSGTGSVQIQNVTISGSSMFKVSGFTGAITLRPGGTLLLTVSFTPTAVGSFSGSVAITASAGASISVPLTGSGTGQSITYSNIDDSTTLNANGSTVGWGWCSTSTCAGGSGTATQKMYWGQQPSLDGNGSTQFMISGNAYADGLWWYKVGANDNVSNFKFDFWLNVSQAATSYAQALEFDIFQYISPTRYMFGTQCDYASGYRNGVWDVWNAGTGHWYSTGLACPAFIAGDWYHITWNFNRTSDLNEHYNSVTVQHYDSTGQTQLSSSTTNVDLAFSSNALPTGWNDNMGVNFQLDINGVPGSTGTATYTTFVDEVTLTVW
jgi:hypothetical protein